MFTDHDLCKNGCQLFGKQAEKGYDWWWHSFTAYSEKTGKPKSFYIEYFLTNPKLGGAEPTFDPPSYLMVNVGAWGEMPTQLHRFYGWDKIRVEYGTPYVVDAGECYATETRLWGKVAVTEQERDAHPEWMTDAGFMSWDLRLNKQIPFNVGYGTSSVMRKLQLFEMFWHAEGMKTTYDGEIIYNGEKFIATPERSFGYADKNWGKDFTTPWLWLSSNNLTGEISGKRLYNSVFDIGGGRPKIGFLSFPGKLLSAFYYEGTPYEFNFSKFWTFTRTKFEAYETDDEVVWHVEQKTWRNRLVADVMCQKKDMLLIRYQAPDGSKRHTRLYNGGTGVGTLELYSGGRLIDRIHAENIGCEYGEYDATKPYKPK